MMTQFETKSLAVMRRQATAMERIASALEREPREKIEELGVIAWQDAVRVMQVTCLGAVECGTGCPMNEWCQTCNKEGSAPAKWELVENNKEEIE